MENNYLLEKNNLEKTEKINLLTDHIVDYIAGKYYESITSNIPDYVVLDGGECCGKTTAVNNIEIALKNTPIVPIIIREPSTEAKKQFIAAMENDGSLKNPTEKSVSFITDVFMKDRENIHNKIVFDGSGRNIVYISDRSIFSTFMYQSGILNPAISPETLNKFCEIIRDSEASYKVKLPMLSILFGSFDSTVKPEITDTNPITSSDGVNWAINSDPDFVAFQSRIDKKKKAGTDNDMDSISTCLTINDIYTTVGKKVVEKLNNKHGIYNVITIEHKLSMQTICDTIVNHIKVMVTCNNAKKEFY